MRERTLINGKLIVDTGNIEHLANIKVFLNPTSYIIRIKKETKYKLFT